jgi:hypothetical protein
MQAGGVRFTSKVVEVCRVHKRAAADLNEREIAFVTSASPPGQPQWDVETLSTHVR